MDLLHCQEFVKSLSLTDASELLDRINSHLVYCKDQNLVLMKIPMDVWQKLLTNKLAEHDG